MEPTESDWQSLGVKLAALELTEGETAALAALVDAADVEVRGFGMGGLGDLLGVSGSAQPNSGIWAGAGRTTPSA